MQAINSVSRYTTPDEWASRLSGPADFSSDRTNWSTALMRHWSGTSPEMDQPLLNHHYVVQHLGGAKRVERWRDGAPISTIVEEGSITIVPLGTEFKWHTQGPIEFAHLYIAPDLFKRTALRFERATEVTLVDRVGCRDPLLRAVYAAMLAEIRRPGPIEELFLDCLLETFLTKLVLAHSTAHIRLPRAQETLPMYQLRRVTEYVEARLSHPLELADLARAAGASVFHFSRAFRNTAGSTPYKYVLWRRTERAKRMLSGGNQPIAAIAADCGFKSTANFAKTFRRLVGTTPKRYRRM